MQLDIYRCIKNEERIRSHNYNKQIIESYNDAIYSAWFLRETKNSNLRKCNAGYEITSLTQNFGTKVMTGPSVRYGALKNQNNGLWKNEESKEKDGGRKKVFGEKGIGRQREKEKREENSEMDRK